jgi:hypothetical protein
VAKSAFFARESRRLWEHRLSWKKDHNMVRRLMLVLALGLAVIGPLGCGEKAKEKTTTSVQTPGGKTTTTEEKTVKQSGDNPPPAPGGPKSSTTP